MLATILSIVSRTQNETVKVCVHIECTFNCGNKKQANMLTRKKKKKNNIKK